MIKNVVSSVQFIGGCLCVLRPQTVHLSVAHCLPVFDFTVPCSAQGTELKFHPPTFQLSKIPKVERLILKRKTCINHFGVSSQIVCFILSTAGPRRASVIRLLTFNSIKC